MTLDLQSLSTAPPPPVDRVRRRVSRRRTRRRVLGASLVAALAVGVGLVAAPGVRDRGVGDAPLVALSAVAQGPDGARPLADGAVVRPEERVVFFVRSSAAGDATLREGDAPLYPDPGGTWALAAGESAPGGASPLAWRPDAPLAGPVRYRAEVCAEPGRRCGRATMTLRWAP
ncbi:MAG: hypothetical protein R3F59_34040 [Myxococcota bacterium]